MPKETWLVTGGAGFIGSNFINLVFEKADDVNIINLDLLTYAGNLENLKGIANNSNYLFVKGDITDSKLLDKIFSGTINSNFKPTKVIHFAAESHVDRSIVDASPFINTNVVGTQKLLDSARKHWEIDGKYSDNYKFIHVSTDEVFGSLSEDGLFQESTPYAPNSPYSASKASSDLLVRAYYETYKFPAIITNCSNNYGPYQFPEKLIPLFLNNIIQRKSLPVYGKGQNVRDWLYVTDHCEAILTILNNAKVGERYNIGGNNEWKNIDLIKVLIKLMDKKLKNTVSSESLITYVTDRKGHDLRYAIDSSKIKKELGWQPKETFESGIQKTIDWYLNNEDWLKNVTSGEYKDYYQKMYAR